MKNKFHEAVYAEGMLKNMKSRRITAAEAYKIMKNNPKAIILDVRSGREYADVRIPGAINLPENQVRSRAKQVLPDDGVLILVYCLGGSRSRIATETLTEMGYNNVCDFGGINSWTYEVEY